MTFYLLLFLVLFCLGLVFLTFSAELLVRGSSDLAALLGVSTFVIGATIVAYGTSMPEFMVSSLASLQGASSIALGNVVGSNLFNTGLILGIAALIYPIAVPDKLHKKLSRIETPYNLVLTLIVAVMSLGLVIGRGKGIVLLVFFCAYILIMMRNELADRKLRNQENEHKKKSKRASTKTYILLILAIIIGLVGLLASARVMVEAAIMIAGLMGISERIIGLTIVALGTSLPELAAAVAAARKKETDMVLGNLIGSNLFNLGLILGAAAAIRPISLEPKGQLVDFGFLLVNAGMITLFLISWRKINRLAGCILVGCYGLFALALAVL